MRPLPQRFLRTADLARFKNSVLEAYDDDVFWSCYVTNAEDEEPLNERIERIRCIESRLAEAYLAYQVRESSEEAFSQVVEREKRAYADAAPWYEHTESFDWHLRVTKERINAAVRRLSGHSQNGSLAR
jgi:hypothetical protein